VGVFLATEFDQMPYPTVGRAASACQSRLREPHHQAGRVGDIILASTLLVITLPLMVLTAIAIKCDSRGPVLVREERRDPRGRRFFAFKFRSTVYRSAQPWRVDPEVTFVGSIIRFLSVDKLPQLINVLRGEMTCVTGNPECLFLLE
jgi:lipopolysaccharide/colanic/teichoic acid biosynthesis glycosyltransferase